jgi:hypothetical protein
VADVARVRVDYAGLRTDPAWPQVVASLAACRPETLATREERLAFWIDAYNVLAIDTVVRAHPVASIRDVGSLLRPVWKREAGRIAGQPYTLDEIEHGVLRPLGDPRIHAAIVCASVSCPALRREPYVPGRIDAQLDDALARFLADPEKGARFDPASGTLTLSPIFDWFAKDFAAQGGVLAALGPRFPAPLRSALASRGSAPTIAYFDYDWSLNDLATAPPSPAK